MASVFEYTISGVAGQRKVIASDDEEAKHLAMVVQWGPPHGLYLRANGRYQGLGLTIESKEEISHDRAVQSDSKGAHKSRKPLRARGAKLHKDG